MFQATAYNQFHQSFLWQLHVYYIKKLDSLNYFGFVKMVQLFDTILAPCSSSWQRLRPWRTWIRLAKSRNRSRWWRTRTTTSRRSWRQPTRMFQQKMFFFKTVEKILVHVQNKTNWVSLHVWEVLKVFILNLHYILRGKEIVFPLIPCLTWGPWSTWRACSAWKPR